MAAGDLLLVLIRALHGLAAVVWIGAMLYELMVIPPNVADELPRSTADRMRMARLEIAQASLIAFLATGAVMTFDRLSHIGADSAYVGVLALKVALSIALFQLAFRTRAATGRRRFEALRWQAALGGIILVLAALLKYLFERATIG